MLSGSFYRMDHIYEVIREFRRDYRGSFSILEFGVADGYAFTKKLYATRYLGMADRIVLHGFDSFEGMPAPTIAGDRDLVANDGWVEGQFNANYENLKSYCCSKYQNFQLHKGYFEDTLTHDFLESLRAAPPLLIWIDCDYYSSARAVFERLIPYIPTGCVIYFDDIDFNFGSRFSGEAKIIYEINAGMLGNDVELVLDSNLSLSSKRIYRFINADNPNVYERVVPLNTATELRHRTNDSPFP